MYTGLYTLHLAKVILRSAYDVLQEPSQINKLSSSLKLFPKQGLL